MSRSLHSAPSVWRRKCVRATRKYSLQSRRGTKAATSRTHGPCIACGLGHEMHTRPHVLHQVSTSAQEFQCHVGRVSSSSCCQSSRMQNETQRVCLRVRAEKVRVLLMERDQVDLVYWSSFASVRPRGSDLKTTIFSNSLCFRASLGHVTQRRRRFGMGGRGRGSWKMLTRTVFLHIIQFLAHVGPTVVALQDRRPAVETRSEVFYLSMSKKKRGDCNVAVRVEVARAFLPRAAHGCTHAARCRIRPKPHLTRGGFRRRGFAINSRHSAPSICRHRWVCIACGLRVRCARRTTSSCTQYALPRKSSTVVRTGCRRQDVVGRVVPYGAPNCPGIVVLPAGILLSLTLVVLLGIDQTIRLKVSVFIGFTNLAFVVVPGINYRIVLGFPGETLSWKVN